MSDNLNFTGTDMEAYNDNQSGSLTQKVTNIIFNVISWIILSLSLLLLTQKVTNNVFLNTMGTAKSC